MGDLDERLRDVTASVYFDWAVNPGAMANLQAFISDGNRKEVVTEETVRRRFGDRAADAWLAARKAKADFFAAVKDGTA